jgi:hypothetical protein
MMILPTEEKALASAIESLDAKGTTKLNTMIPDWIVAKSFLAGVRDFESIDYRNGRVQCQFVNEHGELRFKNEEILRNYQVELGRFLGIDIRPSVTMKGWGLDRLRAAAIGQVILDYEIDEYTIAQARSPFMEQLLQCGCSAMSGWVEDAGLLQGTSSLEIINPGELIPIPYNAKSPQQAVGIMRRRWVSFEGLKSTRIGDRLKRINNEKLMLRELDWGEMEAALASDQEDGESGVVGTFASAFRGAAEAGVGVDKKLSKVKEGKIFVKLVETWLWDVSGHVQRYIVKVGKAIVLDENYEKDGKTIYKPIGIARYYPVGFYGRSYVLPQVPFAYEAERALESMFQTLRDMDPQGILALPTSLGIRDSSFQLGGRPKKLYFNPDPLQPSLGPTSIQQYGLGSFPKQGMEVASAYLQRLGGQSEMFSGDAPGRTDSAAGFGMLLETNNVGIEAPGNSIADCCTTVYTAVLGGAKDRLTTQDMAEIASLDTNIVGVVLNADGKLSLDDNPVPDPDNVKINIKSRTPPSKTQTINELRQELMQGTIDQRQYRLISYRKGLDLPVGNDGEYQSWRKARLSIRQLFNDGETPGEGVAVDTEADDQNVFLDEIQAFMASPEYTMASKRVKDAFVKYKRRYAMMIGGYPEQLPYPDEVGEEPPGAVMGSAGGLM